MEADFLYLGLDSVRLLLLRSYGRTGPLGRSATTARNFALVVYRAFSYHVAGWSIQVSRPTD